MARFSRVGVVDVAHHVTQRGNARQVILANDADRVAYLDLLRQSSELYRLSLLGYCLMSNHVHLIVVPHTAGAMSQTLKHTHGRYASYWNARQPSTGHVWQGRVYSCPLDDSHLWAGLRYVELNPVRAGMVSAAQEWPWSSAAAHLQPRGFGHNAGNGGLGKAVDSDRVEGVSGRRRIAKRGQCTAPVHAHGSTAGNQRIRCCTRTDDFEVSGSPQRRTAEKARSQLPAGPPSFCCVVFGKLGNVPSVPGFPIQKA